MKAKTEILMLCILLGGLFYEEVCCLFQEKYELRNPEL